MRGGLAALHALRRFARPGAVASDGCERCGGGLQEDHRHLFAPATRALLCACRACVDSASLEPHWLPVPQRVRSPAGLVIPASRWRALGVPVELAFVGPVGSEGEVLAVYPGPAGATQTQVSREAWQAVQSLHPALRQVAADVEALLAHRLDGRQHYYIAPIDVCYRLVGLVRAHFRGLRGGAALRVELSRFFSALDARAEVSVA